MSKTILVVEDEVDLLDIIEAMLGMAGFTVLGAGSAAKAMELYEKNSATIDLVLTDVTLPDGTTGVELARKMQSQNPALKVIYSSGHSSDTILTDHSLPDSTHFLQKPFHPSALVEIVQKALGE